MEANLTLDKSWKAALAPELSSPYMAELKAFLLEEQRHGKQIFPTAPEYFRALDLTPLETVRVVILGQDPYHGDGQAHGLSFSVKPGMRLPPSLVNIYKELESDLGIVPARHGFLESWARQGVLLLNSVLTVERAMAASHQRKGWERFTDAIIRAINEQPHPVAFILWGSYAQKKAAFVDRSRHLVIGSPHPSPLSAHNGFFGSKPFSKANDFLVVNGREPIEWALPVDPDVRGEVGA